MKTPRPVVILIASLFATSNAFAIGSDAVASGAAAAGGDPLSEVTASAPPVPPLPSIISGIAEISALPAQAAAAMVDLTIPGLPEMESGKAAYASGKPTCSTQQLTAEKICREKTNPDLQKTAMVINGLVSGMNALNDSCSTSSKVMGLASAALTAYTATCGALRYRCEMTCTSVVKSLAQIQAGLGKGAYCKPMPMSAGACGPILAKFNAAVAKVSAGIKEEQNPADVTTVAGRTKVCTHDYMLLLGSAALGIMSTAKTFAQTSKCDQDSKAESGGGAGSGSAPSTKGSAETGGSNSSSASPSPTPVGTVPPSSSASVNFAGNASAAGVAAAAGGNGDAGVNDAKIGLAANSKSQERGVAADSPYRAFLPGGEKDPNKGQAAMGDGSLVTRREITSANGKNNFEKIRESFRKQSNSLILP